MNEEQNVKKKRISKDDVEKLSKGKPTSSRGGSRNTPHRLTEKERILFEAAKRQGFLKIPVTGARKNLTNIYLKWCEAAGQKSDIRIPENLKTASTQLKNDQDEDDLSI